MIFEKNQGDCGSEEDIRNDTDLISGTGRSTSMRTIDVVVDGAMNFREVINCIYFRYR